MGAIANRRLARPVAPIGMPRLTSIVSRLAPTLSFQCIRLEVTVENGGRYHHDRTLLLSSIQHSVNKNSERLDNQQWVVEQSSGLMKLHVHPSPYTQTIVFGSCSWQKVFGHGFTVACREVAARTEPAPPITRLDEIRSSAISFLRIRCSPFYGDHGGRSRQGQSEHGHPVAQVRSITVSFPGTGIELKRTWEDCPQIGPLSERLASVEAWRVMHPRSDRKRRWPAAAYSSPRTPSSVSSGLAGRSPRGWDPSPRQASWCLSSGTNHRTNDRNTCPPLSVGSSDNLAGSFPRRTAPTSRASESSAAATGPTFLSFSRSSDRTGPNVFFTRSSAGAPPRSPALPRPPPPPRRPFEISTATPSASGRALISPGHL